MNQCRFFHMRQPVLAVKDIEETVNYWHEILGFPNKWTCGEPPNHGGVSWHGAFVQFSLNPQLAIASKGNCIWIRVRNLEKLYEFHLKKNVRIVEPLENKPWGMDFAEDILTGNIIGCALALSDNASFYNI